MVIHTAISQSLDCAEQLRIDDHMKCKLWTNEIKEKEKKIGSLGRRKGEDEVDEDVSVLSDWERSGNVVLFVLV